MKQDSSLETAPTDRTRHRFKVGVIVVLVLGMAVVGGVGSVAGTPSNSQSQSGASTGGDVLPEASESGATMIISTAYKSITSSTVKARNASPLNPTNIETVSQNSFQVSWGPVALRSIKQSGELPQKSTSNSTETPDSSSETIGNTKLSQPDFGKQPITVGRQVRVTVLVTNTGDSQLSTNIGLGTQGQVVDSQQVSLFPGSSQQVSFEYRYDSPGTYAMQIGPLNESDVMTQVGLRDSTVKVTPKAKGTVNDVNGQIGTATTTQVSRIPTITPNQTTTNSSFVTKQTGNLTATNLKVASGSPPYKPGNLVSFEANVTNPTSRQLNGSFTFAVDNGTVSQQSITVPASGDQSIVFTHRFAEAGNHTVSVGNQTATITIQPPQTTAATSANTSATAANASSRGSSGRGSGGIIRTLTTGFIGIFVAVALIVGLGAIIFFSWLQFSTEPEDINR